jgi:hypothetical protein
LRGTLQCPSAPTKPMTMVAREPARAPSKRCVRVPCSRIEGNSMTFLVSAISAAPAT